ncbi:sensor histidine kinase [Pseudonocardia saturnea]
MGSADPPGSADAVTRFDLAMQRAVGTGLALALVLGTVTAVLGPSLYPTWWWAGVAPAAATVTLVAVVQCATGRFGVPARAAFSAGVGGSAFLTALAAGDAVRDVGTALMPVVVIAVLGVGFLSAPAVAALLGGVIIVADTVLPALARPAAAAALLTQTAIQVVILLATTMGGMAARHIAVAEELAQDELAGAVAADRAAAAARTERRELEREMHDTVLNTLAAIGRSSLPDSATVRRRCAADARFLRTLRHQNDGDQGADLATRLDAVIGLFVEDGFTVRRPQPDPASQELPAAVVTAMVRATREALNNAREHSGTDHAVVVVSTTDAVTVRIVDHGAGPGSPADARRLGIRRSLAERMHDVGGTADVQRVPDGGTAVVLRWPR